MDSVLEKGQRARCPLTTGTCYNNSAMFNNSKMAKEHMLLMAPNLGLGYFLPQNSSLTAHVGQGRDKEEDNYGLLWKQVWGLGTMEGTWKEQVPTASISQSLENSHQANQHSGAEGRIKMENSQQMRKSRSGAKAMEKCYGKLTTQCLLDSA